MREPHRPSTPVARLLVVALGLFGFVAGPTWPGLQGASSSTGTISAVRTWVAQHTPTRSRAAAKPRPGGHAQAATSVTAAAQQVAAAAPDACPVPAAAPPPGPELPVPSTRAARPPSGARTFEAAPGSEPRGRAPPASARI